MSNSKPSVSINKSKLSAEISKIIVYIHFNPNTSMTYYFKEKEEDILSYIKEEKTDTIERKK